MPACTLVVGAPRSGTSCVAGVLHHLGVRMSLGPYPAPTWINPGGFYEDAEMSFLVTGYARPGDHTRRDARLRAAIQARRAGGVPWGAKSYGLAYCLPLVLGHSPAPVRVVHVTRPVGQSVASAARAFGRGTHIPGIASRAAGAADAARASGVPVLAVAYPDLLADPAAGSARLAEFVGLPPTPAASAWVDPSLRTVF